VSFETLEHIDQHDPMLSEIRRVLAPGGLLIISTQDRLEYAENPRYQSPFHVRELDFKAGSLIGRIGSTRETAFLGFRGSERDGQPSGALQAR
jgi:hypothetical protein